MPYANDKLKEFLRRKRSRIVKEVKARDLLHHLPCLTTTDREEVEAECTRLGNTHAVSLLLDNLTRRENWPEDFISALEECEHFTLSEEVRDAYEALKQPRNQKQKPVAPSSRPANVRPAHVHPPSPVLSTPPHSPASSFPPQQAVQSPLNPTASSARSALPPSRSPEPQLCPDVVHPDATNQQAFPTSVPARPASLPSMVLVPSVNSPSVAPVARALQSEGAQAPHFGVSPESGFPGACTGGVPLTEILEPQGVTPDPQPPFHAHSPESPQPTRLPIQETNPPSHKVNPLHQQPEETSDPTVNQVERRPPGASPEDPGIHPPPPGIHNPPARATVCPPVVVMTHHPLPTLVDSDTEEEFFSKPGVLQSTDEEPVTAAQTTEPCSVTSGDLEISTAAGNLVCEANAHVSPRVNIHEHPELVPQAEMISVTTNDLEFSVAQSFPQEPNVCPEPVELSHQISNLTYTNHSQGPVNRHNSGSPDRQSNCLVDDPAFSPHRGPIEDNFESVGSNSVDQVMETYTIHFSQEPSIQNYDGQPSRLENAVSSQEKSVINLSDKQQQPPTNQHSLTQSFPENGAHLRSGTKTEIITENKSQGEESRRQEKRARNREEQRELSKTGLLPALQNVPLFPTAAIVIGVCALVFAWKLHK